MHILLVDEPPTPVQMLNAFEFNKFQNTSLTLDGIQMPIQRLMWALPWIGSSGAKSLRASYAPDLGSHFQGPGGSQSLIWSKHIFTSVNNPSCAKYHYAGSKVERIQTSMKYGIRLSLWMESLCRCKGWMNSLSWWKSYAGSKPKCNQN